MNRLAFVTTLTSLHESSIFRISTSSGPVIFLSCLRVILIYKLGGLQARLSSKSVLLPELNAGGRQFHK